MTHWQMYIRPPGKHRHVPQSGCLSGVGQMTDKWWLVDCPVCKCLPSWRRAAMGQKGRDPKTKLKVLK